MNYELHPLCTLFPRLAGAEFDALVGDIAANGLREPIVLHNGLIIDGGNRAAACAAAGVEPRYVEFAGGNLVSFVLSANLHRRHLSQGQAAAIVASAQDWAKAQIAGGDRKSENQSATWHFDSVSDRSAQSGASERTQKRADKVAKADPELAKQVAHGKLSLPAAVAQVEGRIKPPPKPRPKLLTEEESASILADNADLRERIAELARDSAEALADNNSMAAILDADDKLAAAYAEIKRLRAENIALKEQLAGAINSKNEAVRHAKGYKLRAEKLERRAASA